MEVLWSSADLGFRPILGNLGREVVDLLPRGLGSRLPVPLLLLELEACPPVIGFLMGLVFMVTLFQSAQS